MFLIFRLVKFHNPKDFSSGIEHQEFITLKPKETATIGRSRLCTNRINDDYSSGKHCELSFTGQEVFINDLNSKNGTKINGVLIKEENFIYVKDIIIIGTTFLHIDEDRTPKEVVKLLEREDPNSLSEKLTQEYQNITNAEFKGSN